MVLCVCVCRCLKKAEALDLLRLGSGNKNLTSEEHSKQRKPCIWRPAVLKMDEAGDWQDSEELGE